MTVFTALVVLEVGLSVAGVWWLVNVGRFDPRSVLGSPRGFVFGWLSYLGVLGALYLLYAHARGILKKRRWAYAACLVLSPALFVAYSYLVFGAHLKGISGIGSYISMFTVMLFIKAKKKLKEEALSVPKVAGSFS